LKTIIPMGNNDSPRLLLLSDDLNYSNVPPMGNNTCPRRSFRSDDSNLGFSPGSISFNRFAVGPTET
jgi:hypothetical protein